MLENINAKEQKGSRLGSELLLDGEVMRDENGSPVRIKYHRMSGSEIVRVVNDLLKLYSDLCARLDQRYNRTIKAEYNYDVSVLQEVVIRTDKRRVHAQIFHDIEESAEFRVLALYCYWIIKLHPFSMVVTSRKDEREIPFSPSHINEYFAVYLYVSAFNSMVRCLKEQHKDKTEYVKTLEKLRLSDNYLRELSYTFRFRDLNKASLIMIFEPQFSLLRPPQE